ncbi:unnamed protein product, partial [Rotaria magnacalcarata]
MPNTITTIIKKTIPSLDELPRRDLQTLAKKHSIKGNLKTEEL